MTDDGSPAGHATEVGVPPEGEAGLYLRRLRAAWGLRVEAELRDANQRLAEAGAHPELLGSARPPAESPVGDDPVIAGVFGIEAGKLGAGARSLTGAGWTPTSGRASLWLGRGARFERNGVIVEVLAGGSSSPARLGSQTLRTRLRDLFGHRREFLGLSLRVGREVFEPHPWTENLARTALRVLDGVASPVVLDVGTGSGAVALAIAKVRPDARVIGTDISERAVHTARRNAVRNRIANAEFRVGPLLEPVARDTPPLNVIVANLPWTAPILKACIDQLGATWRGPATTVSGTGMDGLGLIRSLAEAAIPVLAPGGGLVLEVDFWQTGAIRGYLESLGYRVDPAEDGLVIARFPAD